MFILSLTYKVPNDDVDRHLDDHVAWIKEGYAKGIFLAAGRKVPRTGGIILATGTRAEVEAMAKHDPFTIHGIADYDIKEVNITSTADGLEGLKG